MEKIKVKFDEKGPNLESILIQFAKIKLKESINYLELMYID